MPNINSSGIMMTGKKKKTTAGKLTGLMVGPMLVMGLVLCWLTPTPCSGMDALTHTEMAELSGQSGISITWCTSATTTTSFTSLTPVPGDTDGWGNSTNDNPGWLVFIGDGSNTGYIKIATPSGAKLTVDVATSGSGTCQPAGGTPYAGIQVPPNTVFFTLTLSEFYFSLINPETVNIMATDDPTGAPASMDQVGWVKATGLSIDKAVQTSTCYIWRHD